MQMQLHYCDRCGKEITPKAPGGYLSYTDTAQKDGHTMLDLCAGCDRLVVNRMEALLPIAEEVKKTIAASRTAEEQRHMLLKNGILNALAEQEDPLS